MPLSESLTLLIYRFQRLMNQRVKTAELLKNKMNTIFKKKNVRMRTIKKYIEKMHCGITNEDMMELNLSLSKTTAIKYTLITSYDVERFIRSQCSN